MEKILWNDSYATGIHSIDFQHKILIGILNDLIEAHQNPQDSRLWLDVVLDELNSYTKYHFSNESVLMGKHEYQDRENHSELHAGFIKQLNSLTRQYHSETEDISEHLIDYLTDWLINHILKEDKKLGVFLNSCQTKD